MKNEVVLGNVMVDCDDNQKLRRFYSEMLGWQACELFDLPAVLSKTGVAFLFIQEEDNVPPVWPEKPGAQQKQMHFDFQVENVPEAVERAQRLGARLAAEQFGGEDFVTLLDPAGHPFCLCRKE